jgi:hypothetical protein
LVNKETLLGNCLGGSFCFGRCKVTYETTEIGKGIKYHFDVGPGTEDQASFLIYATGYAEAWKQVEAKVKKREVEPMFGYTLPPGLPIKLADVILPGGDESYSGI